MRPILHHLPTVDSSADQAVWDELDQVLDQLSNESRTAQAPEEFYRAVIAKLAPLLAASGAVVWLRQQGTLRIVTQTADWAESIDDRPAHERLIAAALDSSEVVLVAPGAAFGGVSNPSDSYYLIAPVTLRDWTDNASGGVAAMALLLPVGRAPSSYQGAEQLIVAVRDLAAEFHVRRELARLSAERGSRDELATFAEQIGGDTDLGRTAMVIANEGRRLLDCDRLSVLGVSGGRGRLLASSGTQHIDRRSRAARALAQLAAMAVRLDEPIDYADSTAHESDLSPQVDDVVSRYVDEFHARRLLVLPMAVPPTANPSSRTRGVLVAEQFGGSPAEVDRLAVAELARTAAPALTTAIAWHELPLGSVLRTLGWLKMPRTLFRLAVVSALAVGVIAALLTIPTPLTIDARGQLLPRERQDVFAPRSSMIDSLSAVHGQRVEAGQTLVVLRDPQLDVEIDRLLGERATTREQLDAVRAVRSSARTPDRDPLEQYRLSGEEEQHKTRLANLDRQLELLAQQESLLSVVAPIAGTVTTWRVDQRLAPGRPVERGQVLVSVADTLGDWIIELSVPDERLDLLREAAGENLLVEYRLGSDASDLLKATVNHVAQRADVVVTPSGDERREVRVEATPNGPVPDELRAAAMRPGGSVRGRIVVGNKPLGYVLFHDLWRTVRNWWEF